MFRDQEIRKKENSKQIKKKKKITMMGLQVREKKKKKV